MTGAAGVSGALGAPPVSGALGAPPWPGAAPDDAASGCSSCLHVPRAVTSTQYSGAVAASSRSNTVFEETPIVVLPRTGITQAKFCGGPAYLIRTTAVTVESGLSMNRISSAVWWTGALCEDQK